jgi:pilus assembly protein CpaB
VARRTLLIIASILLAALGTALIWLYVQGAENRAQQNAELVPALFLTANVPAGQSPANAVKEQAVPPAVAANAVTSRQELGNQTLQVTGVAGQVLLKTMLSSSQTSAARFPAGGAASVTINDPNRVPADLKPGDTVDVVDLSKDNAQLASGLSGLTVRTIGPLTQTGTTTAGANSTTQNGTIPPTIVGLNVNSEQAVLLYAIVAKGDQVALYLHGGKSQ